MTMLSIRQTQFMTAKKIAEERDARIATIENELLCKHLSAEHRRELAKLKRVLNDRTSKSFANIVYASQQQEKVFCDIKYLIDNYRILAETNKLDPQDVYFVTINCCEGRSNNKKPYFAKPKDLLNFNIDSAKKTLLKQLSKLERCCGYVSFEVKYDMRMGAFLPHFHILICGKTKKELKHFLKENHYTNDCQFMLNHRTFHISKNGDPLIYERPQSLKIARVDLVKFDADNESLASYMCKFKTYMTNYHQRHLTAKAYSKTSEKYHIRPNDSVHNYHLLFLDKLSKLSQHLFQFNKKLLTNFIDEKSDELVQRCLKTGKTGKELVKQPKKRCKHDTYKTPLSSNDIVLQFLGYQSYKSQQEEIINYMKNHQYAMVIQPTNFGKSLCYYASALQMKGLCIVIEPTVSLIYDQVSKLNKKHKKLALAFTGEAKNKDKKLKNLSKGKYKFLYIAPEMLNNIEFKKVLSKLDICMIAVDEAHCIDIWGNDFRPDYQELLNKLIKKYSDAKVMALTATAGNITQKVIKKVCNMPKKAKVFKGALDRPNIKYEVVKKIYDGLQQLLDTLKPYLDKNNKPTTSIIIYCAHIDYTKGIQDILKKRGIDSYVYNSKVDNKKEILKKFKKEKCIVLATSAFGMGIDKADVHLVIHFEGTNNLEMYYQESGRAGRDGESSEAVLFYCDREIERNKNLASKESQSVKEKLKLAIEYMQMTNNKKRRKFLLNSIV